MDYVLSKRESDNDKDTHSYNQVSAISSKFGLLLGLVFTNFLL